MNQELINFSDLNLSFNQKKYFIKNILFSVINSLKNFKINIIIEFRDIDLANIHNFQKCLY